MTKRGERRSGLTGQSIVQKLVGEAQERQEAERTDGRGRAGHGGERGVDKRGISKATFNISLASQEQVTELARSEQVTKADIVEAAILAFYNAWQAGRVELEAFKIITYSQTQPWRSTVKLELPEDFSLFREE